MKLQTDVSAQISIIIPTYERPHLVHDILYNQIIAYSGHLFEVIIHDTSRNDDTQQEYMRFAKEIPAHPNVAYIRYPHTTSLPSKIMLAIEACKTPYFYISGDGIKLHYDILEKELLGRIQYENFDVININSNKGYYCTKKGKHDKLFFYGNDSRRFVTETMSLMTLYGASIVKKSLFMESIGKGYFDKFFKANDGLNGYVYVSTLCENIIEHQDLNLVSFFSDATEANSIPKPAENKWLTGESFYIVGLKRFINSINALENLNLSEKKAIIKRYYKVDWSAFKIINILSLTESEMLSRNIVKKYKIYLKEAGIYPLFLFCCFFPSKIYILIKIIRKKVKNLYNRLFSLNHNFVDKI